MILLIVTLLLVCHIFFTIKLKFIQRYTLSGIKYTFSRKENEQGIGTYSAFAAALGTTVGPGNIVGVAVAISAGGVGSIFWMWVCGVLSMSTKYAESYLALKYADNGVGGTMTLLKTLNKPTLSLIWTLACAACGLFMGAAVPSSSLAAVLPFDNWQSGVVLAFLTIVTISLGFNGIAKISSLLVPIMSISFLGFCIFIIFDNVSLVPAILKQIFCEAFDISSLFGGTMGAAVKSGVTRGLYSNESGLGSGGVLAAESGDKNIVKCSLSAMTTAFWDTVVMCSITGIAFALCGAKLGDNPNIAVKSTFASYPFGSLFLSVSMSLFVFATVIGWYYVARRVLLYSFKSTDLYDAAFAALVFFGAVLPPSFLWSAADTLNVFMLLPSLYTLIRLSNKINLYITNK